MHDRYDATVVTSGELALNFLETKTVDLIILDYDMPVMSGTEVFAKLRDNKKTRGIPVIFLTGVTDRQKISKAPMDLNDTIDQLDLIDTYRIFQPKTAEFK